MKRINDLENQEYNSQLYRDKALLDNIIKLKHKLKELIQNDADIENIVKSFSKEDVFFHLNYGR